MKSGARACRRLFASNTGGTAWRFVSSCWDCFVVRKEPAQEQRDKPQCSHADSSFIIRDANDKAIALLSRLRGCRMVDRFPVRNGGFE
jgi:hypothetical protein